MRLTRQNSNEIQGVSRWVDDEFDNLIAVMQAGWNVQHKPDSTHSDITCDTFECADSITEHGRSTPQGEWQTIPFNAANFTSNAGTFTVASGDVTVLEYMLIGYTMWIRFKIVTASVSGTPNDLYIAFPSTDFVNENESDAIGYADENGTESTFLIIAEDAQSRLKLVKIPTSGTWNTVTNTLGLRGQICVRLVVPSSDDNDIDS